MRHDPIFLTWLVRCSSPDEARRLRDWLANHISLDTTFEDVIRGNQEGEEPQRVEYHRLGDYFEEIRILPGPPELPPVFRVLFHRRSDAGRFWKDLMARIVVSLQKETGNPTTELEYKGDEDPVATDRTVR